MIIEDAATKEEPALLMTECNRETIGLAVTITIVATEEVEEMISEAVTTLEVVQFVGISTMILEDRSAEVDHQVNIKQEETITAEITARQRS